GARSTELRAVLVDRLARDVAQAQPAEVGDNPTVEHVCVGGKRRRFERCARVLLPPFLEERRDGLLGANDLARQLAQVLRASHGRVEAARILLARKRLLMRRRAAASFAPSYDPAIAAFPDRHQPPEPMRSRNEVEGRTARRAGSRTSTGALGTAPRFSRSP